MHDEDPKSDCTYLEAVLGLRCLQMPKTFIFGHGSDIGFICFISSACHSCIYNDRILKLTLDQYLDEGSAVYCSLLH